MSNYNDQVITQEPGMATMTIEASRNEIECTFEQMHDLIRVYTTSRGVDEQSINDKLDQSVKDSDSFGFTAEFSNGEWTSFEGARYDDSDMWKLLVVKSEKVDDSTDESY
ncbi:hypothetical protein IWW39_002548, partial [Coemansia spiralis]